MFSLIASTRDFLIQGIGRWAKAYAAMCKNEEAFRDDYELWKDELRDHFSKRGYSAIYPDYDPMKPNSGQWWTSDRFAVVLRDIRRICGLK